MVQALRTLRNFRGITVTIPHKPAIGAMLERLSQRAQAAGAVNLVRLDPDGRLCGDIVDGAGFVRGLELRGHSGWMPRCRCTSSFSTSRFPTRKP